MAARTQVKLPGRQILLDEGDDDLGPLLGVKRGFEGSDSDLPAAAAVTMTFGLSVQPRTGRVVLVVHIGHDFLLLTFQELV